MPAAIGPLSRVSGGEMERGLLLAGPVALPPLTPRVLPFRR